MVLVVASELLMTKVRKAVFPVAGIGTRFLPATKANPKEMLPIVDKPLIQFAVEEAIAAGITELIFITNSSKRSIEDHFDRNFELEQVLQARGDEQMLAEVKNILPEGVSCAFIRQTEALGLGHAVLCAQAVVGNEPFAVMLADDLIKSEPPCLEQMLDVFNQQHGAVLAVQDIPRQATSQYGVIDVAKEVDGALQISGIVEKPLPEVAPSNYGVVGRYILPPEIFELLANTKPGVGGEIQLTDALAGLLELQNIYALPFVGVRYDCGSKLGYLQATLDYALSHEQLGVQVRDYLVAFVQQNLIESV